jgi:hypothetical protein
LSQQIQELADGNLELSLILISLEEIVSWILSWGKDCEVIMSCRKTTLPTCLSIKSYNWGTAKASAGDELEVPVYKAGDDQGRMNRLARAIS